MDNDIPRDLSKYLFDLPKKSIGISQREPAAQELFKCIKDLVRDPRFTKDLDCQAAISILISLEGLMLVGGEAHLAQPAIAMAIDVANVLAKKFPDEKKGDDEFIARNTSMDK